MDCERVSEDMTDSIRGLCWADDHTLIVTDTNSGVYKYTVDIGEKTCIGERIDSGYIPGHADCTKDGRVYITEFAQRNVSVQVRIYNLKTNTTQIWKPSISADHPRITSNDDKIIITSYYDSYVYANNHNFLFKITHPKVTLAPRILDTYLSPTDIFWGCTSSNNYLLMMKLLTNETKMYELGQAYSVSGIQGGHVFVTEFGVGVIRVYTHSGVFLNKIQTGPPERLVGKHDVTLSKDGQIYLAFRGFNASFPLVIYSIDT